MPHRIRADGARLLDCNPRSICGCCPARQSASLNMCGYGLALWRMGELPGGLEWNVDFLGPGKNAGGQIVLAQGLAAETIPRSHEPRSSGQCGLESDSADHPG